jgi:molybdenum cofactor cytidylyltransferase
MPPLPEPANPDRSLTIGAVVLAAGSSRRFGDEDKLLADIAGQPMVARVVGQLLAAGLRDIVVVTAPGSAVAATLQRFPIRSVPNPVAATGIGSSIACGVSAMPAVVDGIMIVPGDMPALDASLICRLVDSFAMHGATSIVYPCTKAGEQRNPVVWPATCRAHLEGLSGELGGKPLLRSSPAPIQTISVPDTFVSDIDTPADLLEFRRRQTAKPPA